MFIVTGANGFIGSCLVKELNEHGVEDIWCADVVGLEKRPELLRTKRYSRFLETENILPELKGQKPQCIFHMGACSSTLEMDREYLKKNNTLYTQELFEFSQKHEVPFIYASSGAVYGDGSKGFDDEKDPHEYVALNPYGESKLLFDQWVWGRQGLWFGLRFFNVFGPNEYHKGPMRSVAYKAFLQIQENGSLKLFKSENPKYKDGYQKRDFIYVKDVVRGMWELYQRREQVQPGIYNLGFGKARAWIELAQAAFQALGKPEQIEWIDLPENLKKQYQYFTEAKMDKWLSQGLPAPQWPLEEAIEDYYKRYLLGDHIYW